MKLEVGMYVRTDTGIIEKIEKIYEQNETTDTHIQLNKMGTGKSVFILDKGKELSNSKGEVIKSSPNIIDLIEVGDYVNEYLVEDITSVYDNGEEIITLHIASGSNYFQHNINDIKDIKSIVTKEQFESMEYKVC